MVIFFYKQKTAYEMRISDWSSDVCSSDLVEQVSAATVTGLRPILGARAGNAAASAYRLQDHAIGSLIAGGNGDCAIRVGSGEVHCPACARSAGSAIAAGDGAGHGDGDRKSTRLNSSH